MNDYDLLTKEDKEYVEKGVIRTDIDDYADTLWRKGIFDSFDNYFKWKLQLVDYFEKACEKARKVLSHVELWTDITSKAQSLGKYEAKAYTLNGKRYLLAGTPLAYEDVIEGKVEECFDKLKEVFGVKFENDCDVVSRMRDILVYEFEKLANGRIVNGYEEY